MNLLKTFGKNGRNGFCFVVVVVVSSEMEMIIYRWQQTIYVLKQILDASVYMKCR